MTIFYVADKNGIVRKLYSTGPCTDIQSDVKTDTEEWKRKIKEYKELN